MVKFKWCFLGNYGDYLLLEALIAFESLWLAQLILLTIWLLLSCGTGILLWGASRCSRLIVCLGLFRILTLFKPYFVNISVEEPSSELEWCWPAPASTYFLAPRGEFTIMQPDYWKVHSQAPYKNFEGQWNQQTVSSTKLCEKYPVISRPEVHRCKCRYCRG